MAIIHLIRKPFQKVQYPNYQFKDLIVYTLFANKCFCGLFCFVFCLFVYLVVVGVFLLVELERMTRKDQIADLKVKFEDEIELLQTRLTTLKVEKNKDDVKAQQEAIDTAEHHRQVMQDLEHNHNQKLLQE